MKGKVNDMKKSKTNVFRILSVILMLVMVVSAVNEIGRASCRERVSS